MIDPHPLDEPRPAREDVIEWGGELILAHDFTEGGAPIGHTEREFRTIGRRSHAETGWARAADALRRAAAALGSDDAAESVGQVSYLGKGLTYVAYQALCTFPDGQSRTLVVRLPRADAPDDQKKSSDGEVRVLRYLERLDLPFRIPRFVASVPVETGMAIVQEKVAGIPADLRASRFAGHRPWNLVASVAAAVHSLDPDPLRSSIAGHATRRDHAASFARVLESVHGSEGDEARAWAAENLPGDEPSRLLHGDLLGQNLLLAIDDQSVGVVDWSEASLGDPAYDLAIVTRGVRRPFQTTDGLQHLLAEYNRRAAAPLSLVEIHFHELCLRGQLYIHVKKQYGSDAPHALQSLRAMTNVLRRAHS